MVPDCDKCGTTMAEIPPLGSGRYFCRCIGWGRLAYTRYRSQPAYYTIHRPLAWAPTLRAATSVGELPGQ